mgnify:CR=1 FL=1
MSAKKLIPLLDRVLVQRIVPPTKSMGGVLLPDSAAQKVFSHILLLYCIIILHLLELQKAKRATLFMNRGRKGSSRRT